MNFTPEQLKENAAAMIAFAEGKPIQAGPDWKDCDSPSWNLSLWSYRPKPDPIAPGHNPDKLTVSQVGEGWRLLDLGEICDRPARRTVEKWFGEVGWNNMAWQGSATGYTYRTRLTREELAALDKPAWKMPTPPAGQQWHREGWTESDLPTGYRPMLLDEKCESGDEYFDDEIWVVLNYHPDHRATATAHMGLPRPKHRTRRPLPSAPKIVPWDCASDIPKTVRFVRWSKGPKPTLWTTISAVCEDGILSVASSADGMKTKINFTSWQDLAEEHECSPDLESWGPCTKEVK